MKKLGLCLLVLMLLAGCSSTPASSTGYADTYTTASPTRTRLEGADYAAAAGLLAGISNDLATKADATAEGYVAPESATLAQVMSVNPDGSVSMSTIHAWKVVPTDKGATVTVVMTDGQTIQNLAEVGKRGTIMVHSPAGYYMMHVQTSEVVALAYSDEAYNEGKFNVDYSGAERQLTEYTVTFDIYDMENTWVYVFD